MMSSLRDALGRALARARRDGRDAFVWHSEPLPDLGALSLPAVVALIYLFLFPMSFCQWAYFKVVTLLPASVAAIGTLLVPVIGVYSSNLILDEPVGIAELSALLLILSALAMVLLLPTLRDFRRD